MSNFINAFYETKETAISTNHTNTPQPTYCGARTQFKGTASNDSYESSGKKKKGKIIGISLLSLTGLTALALGILAHKGGKTLEKDAKLGEKIKQGWKEFRGKGTKKPPENNSTPEVINTSANNNVPPPAKPRKPYSERPDNEISTQNGNIVKEFTKKGDVRTLYIKNTNTEWSTRIVKTPNDTTIICGRNGLGEYFRQVRQKIDGVERVERELLGNECSMKYNKELNMYEYRIEGKKVSEKEYINLRNYFLAKDVPEDTHLMKVLKISRDNALPKNKEGMYIVHNTGANLINIELKDPKSFEKIYEFQGGDILAEKPKEISYVKFDKNEVIERGNLIIGDNNLCDTSEGWSGIAEYRNGQRIGIKEESALNQKLEELRALVQDVNGLGLSDTFRSWCDLSRTPI